MLVKAATWESLRRRVEDAEIIPDPKDFDVSTRGGKKFIRLRGNPGSIRPGSPPIPPLTLSAGAEGSRIYKGVLEWSVVTLGFEKITIEGSGEEVNSFTGQDAISGVRVMKRGGESDPEEDSEDGWWDLNWWGDVWAKVILDPETGEPVSWDIVGPDEPEMIAIPELDGELSRGPASEEGETGYAVLIGNVPEDGPIIQERTGNLEWFCAFVSENESSSSGTSESSSSSSGSSSSGTSSGSSSGGSSSSFGSDKSTAIVPATFHSTGYTALFTMEAPDVRFEDVAIIHPKRRKVTYRPDKRFLEVCEKDSVVVVSACPSSPAIVGAVFVDGAVSIEIVTRRKLPESIVIKLSGIRRGFRDMRFPIRTEAQFQANERFLNSAYPRK